ncbi:MAG: sulfotransferase, partial [Pseudomonadota bacterium]
DVVNSMMERNMIEMYDRFEPWREQHSSTFAACCAYVAEQHEAMLRFQTEHPDEVHTIRYEGLVENAEQALRPACTFLGLDFAPQMLDFASARHDVGFGDEKIHQTKAIIPRLGNFAKWSEQERREAKGHLRGCLDALEYAA